MDTPFKIHTKSTDTDVEIEISGDLIINHIEKIKVELDSVIDFSKDLVLKLDNPSSLDITFIQLVLSLKRSFQKNEKKLTFMGSFNDEISGLLTNAGLQDLF